MLTSSLIKVGCPNCKDPDAVVAALEPFLGPYSVNTPVRLAAFLAQLAEESGEFNHTVENLNYSAAGLLRTWPTRFTAETAAEHAMKPEMIANTVYGGRMGNTAPGDGWLYRGRGWIMLTGRANYAKVEAGTGLLLTVHPELLSVPRNAAHVACWYWQTHNGNTYAETGGIQDETRAVNGGLIGLEHRQVYFDRFKKALGI